ncbi:MAG: magnesium and cobalt transport protein CorA [Nitrospirae bacterium RBG_13_43_8]|nr:MAG: magnesium and cobalt transport protein CorA [Nitrospirae bacterium RBG_13_43_8]
MPELMKKRSRKAGLPPGTLIHIGEKKTEEVKITIMDYDETQLQEKEAKTFDECFPYKGRPTVTWINVDGIHQIETLEKLGECFELHPLTLEDVLNTDQRPKMEDFGDYMYIVLKMFSYNDKNNEILIEQVSFILGSNFVLSFQENVGDVFDPIRERIRSGKGRIRKMGADYLLYSLLDAIVDNYFIILEKIGEQIEFIEERLIINPASKTLNIIHKLKRDMLFLRRSVWPLREVISGMERGEFSLIKGTTKIYLRDVYDHNIQIIDTIETLREMLSGMLDIYLTSISNRLNAVMKVLTIIATIFMPLTFLAGIYGMNFKYMPELEWKWGYFLILLVMFAIGISMLFYFKKKKWL